MHKNSYFYILYIYRKLDQNKIYYVKFIKKS
nr:MAG TPA: hypothetical protein [Caudoviricetes sp.]